MKTGNKKSSRRIMWVSRLLFAMYMFCVIYFMFFCESFGRTEMCRGYRYNLTPFQEIKRFYNVLSLRLSFSAILNLWGNIVAFIPFGLFLPMIKKEKIGIVNVTILTFGFSLIIETLQLVLKSGVFDIDDLMLNTIGGIIGYLIYTIGRLWVRK